MTRNDKLSTKFLNLSLLQSANLIKFGLNLPPFYLRRLRRYRVLISVLPFINFIDTPLI
ncbi:hypothetical protein CAMRE0001_2484 [Campylobacter rectus RM3267]|uniref:Uncharacterized protein n=1 Tax=Campylobacter rectus RM3267 TaxID=553218 RepID=B9D5C0_CAMRE|nr:hypothetical protein CAMRE0001_2484 [Campylobacter rectus RM3267]